MQGAQSFGADFGCQGGRGALFDSIEFDLKLLPVGGEGANTEPVQGAAGPLVCMTFNGRLS